METKAILKIDDHSKEIVDLYLPEAVWGKIMEKFRSNKLTVVIRMLHEYTGGIRVEEK